MWDLPNSVVLFPHRHQGSSGSRTILPINVVFVMFSATRRQQVYLPPTTPFFIICFSGICNTSHEHMKLPLVAVIPPPPDNRAGLEVRVLRGRLARRGRFRRRQTRNGMGRRRIRRRRAVVPASAAGARQCEKGGEYLRKEGKICKERKTFFEVSHIADVSHC